MPVIEVPAGEEGGPGGLPNLLNKEESVDNEEEKKEHDDYEEEMKGKSRDEEEMQDSPMVNENMNGPIPLCCLCHLTNNNKRVYLW